MGLGDLINSIASGLSTVENAVSTVQRAQSDVQTVKGMVPQKAEPEVVEPQAAPQAPAQNTTTVSDDSAQTVSADANQNTEGGNQPQATA